MKCFTTLKLNTLIFLVKKCEKLWNAKSSHIFFDKNIGVFQMLIFEILTKR